MSDFERGERTSGGSLLKIGDLIPQNGDEISGIFVGVEDRAPKDGGKPFSVFHMLLRNGREVKFTPFDSDFQAQFDNAVANRRFNPDVYPFLFVGVERIGNWDRIDQKTGDAKSTPWWNVYVEAASEPQKNQSLQREIEGLRCRAQQLENQSIPEGRPFGPALANAGAAKRKDDDWMDTSETPF